MNSEIGGSCNYFLQLCYSEFLEMNLCNEEDAVGETFDAIFNLI